MVSMARITPTPPNREQAQRIARELLAAQAGVRARAQYDGIVASLTYDAGIPVSEIADAYAITENAVYKLMERHPLDCHPKLGPGDACTACGTVEVAS
jgi:hypothetical protein